MKATCRTCKAGCQWITCPTGGWWAHDVHPADEHDADPGDPVAPDWLLGFVAAIHRYEDEHAKEDYCFYDQLSLVPMAVRHEASLVPVEVEGDTFPQWLQKRYGHGLNGGNDYEAHESFWQHEADAVRRAMERGGFKTELPSKQEAKGAIKAFLTDRGEFPPPVAILGELTPEQQAKVVDEFSARMGLMDLGPAVVVHVQRTPLIHRTPVSGNKMPCCGNSIYSLTGCENRVTNQDAEVTCTPDKWVKNGDIAVHRSMGAGEPLRCCGKYNGPYTILTVDDNLVTCLGNRACPEAADQKHCSHYTEAQADCCACGADWVPTSDRLSQSEQEASGDC